MLQDTPQDPNAF
jgi:hypothetical protein